MDVSRHDRFRTCVRRSDAQLNSVTRVTVEEKNTVGAMVPGMPYVAATPYLVGMAEMACSRLVKDLPEPGQVTVGSRVVIDHLGPSKVGAELVIRPPCCSGKRIASSFRSRSKTALARSPRSSTSAPPFRWKR